MDFLQVKIKKVSKILFFTLLTALISSIGFAMESAESDDLAGLPTEYDDTYETRQTWEEHAPEVTSSVAEETSSQETSVPSQENPENTETPKGEDISADPKKVARRPVQDVSMEEMKKNWEALFSKEMTPESILYTVKSGDSLYVIALKNHTTVDLIKKTNKLESDTIYPGMKFKINTAPFSILISKSRNTLTLFLKDKPIKEYSVATGKKNSTPAGTFKITAKLVNPTWFKTGAILPPGSPENSLGTRWLGFDKPGYGIHGTTEPESIGKQVSDGCVRMLNEQVEELYGIVPVGIQVTIQD